jgi:hypothetical protein
MLPWSEMANAGMLSLMAFLYKAPMLAAHQAKNIGYERVDVKNVTCLLKWGEEVKFRK